MRAPVGRKGPVAPGGQARRSRSPPRWLTGAPQAGALGLSVPLSRTAGGRAD